MVYITSKFISCINAGVFFAFLDKVMFTFDNNVVKTKHYKDYEKLLDYDFLIDESDKIKKTLILG